MSDPRKDPRVIAVFWAMRGETECHDTYENFEGNQFCYNCEQVVKDPADVCDAITMNLADLAFWMRDQCVEMLWFSHLQINVGKYHDAEETIKLSTREQWIYAACAAWEAKP